MAVRRTKKQKQQAEVKRSQLSYTLPSVKTTATSKVTDDKAVVAQRKATKLFSYNTQYIAKDLKRTAVVTAIVVSMLFGLSVLLR